MKKLISSLLANSYLLMAVLAMAAVDVNAHPGHDHQHWTSGIYHTLASLSVIIVVSALTYLFARRRQQINSKEIQDDNKRG